MINYGFEENSDFRLVAQKRPTNNPKNPYTIGTDYRAITQKRVTAQGNETTYIDHILKIDCAKEICMIQRTDIGRECRKYFLECERKLKEVVDPKAQLLLEIYNGGQGEY